jgi:hypothetical protein
MKLYITLALVVSILVGSRVVPAYRHARHAFESRYNISAALRSS